MLISALHQRCFSSQTCCAGHLVWIPCILQGDCKVHTQFTWSTSWEMWALHLPPYVKQEAEPTCELRAKSLSGMLSLHSQCRYLPWYCMFLRYPRCTRRQCENICIRQLKDQLLSYISFQSMRSLGEPLLVVPHGSYPQGATHPVLWAQCCENSLPADTSQAPSLLNFWHLMKTYFISADI